MFTPELEVLIAAGAWPDPSGSRLLNALAQPLDWPLLIDMADGQGMLPLLTHALSKVVNATVPAESLAMLRLRAASKAMRSLAMAGELVRIMSAFESVGIACIAFKGPTLAYLAYGDLALRDSTDLDIFVPREQLSLAHQVLSGDGYQSKSAGFQTWLDGACEVALQRKAPACEVDLHWEFSPPYFLPFDARRAMERSVVVPNRGFQVRTLRAEDLLLCLCIHAARECWAVRSVCDLAGLLRNCAIDWDELRHEAEGSGCWRSLAVGLALEIDLFGARVAPEVLDQVRRDPEAGDMVRLVVSNLRRGRYGSGRAPRAAMFHLRMLESVKSRHGTFCGERSSQTTWMPISCSYPKTLQRCTISFDPSALLVSRWGGCASD